MNKNKINQLFATLAIAIIGTTSLIGLTAENSNATPDHGSGCPSCHGSGSSGNGSGSSGNGFGR